MCVCWSPLNCGYETIDPIKSLSRAKEEEYPAWSEVIISNTVKEDIAGREKLALPTSTDFSALKGK